MDSETGEPLERSEIVKGYKLDGDQYVILENEELKNLQVESSRILDLETFIDRPVSIRSIWMPRTTSIQKRLGLRLTE